MDGGWGRGTTDGGYVCGHEFVIRAQHCDWRKVLIKAKIFALKSFNTSQHENMKI